MKKSVLFSALAGIVAACMLAGCGSGDTTGTGTVSTLAASESCMNCHGTAVSAVTGQNISEEWLASTHNTGNGASCGDCHEPAAGHPESCSSCHGGGTPSPGQDEVVRNPDAAQKCYKCHGPSHPTDIMISEAPQHFGNMTASIANTTYRASYVSSMYVGNCRKCHNPHDPTSQIGINQDWADSGHGDTLVQARTRYDFKTRGSYEPVNLTFQYYCVRCHTTTGYINFVTSGFTDIAPFAGPGYPVVQNTPDMPSDQPSPDKSKEVTGCNACHDDGQGNSYSFKLRAVPPVRIYYNFSTAWAVSKLTGTTVKLNNNPVDYPDNGASNMCFPCHAGRGTGALIKAAAAAGLDFSSAPVIFAHALTGAATLSRTSGYEFDGRDYTNADDYLHNRIGLNNFQGTGTLGPCITCHMNSDVSHSFTPVAVDATTGAITGIISKTCAHCHNGVIEPAWTPDALQQEQAGMHAALAALSAMLKAKGVPHTINAQKRLRNWEYPYGPGTGPNTMGAYFNYSLLAEEPGAFAHNSDYTKRLIYDSIDWLDNGALDNDVEAAINGLTFPAGTTDPVTGVPYTTGELANLKTTAITYLIGGPGGRP